MTSTKFKIGQYIDGVKNIARNMPHSAKCGKVNHIHIDKKKKSICVRKYVYV